MEAVIKSYLIRRSTVYRDVGPEVLSVLSDMAQASEADPKVLALKFDRFMTVSRSVAFSFLIDISRILRKRVPVLQG